VIVYRRFRNTDPPALAAVWTECFTNRGAFKLPNTALLELCVLSKPYFDPLGLIVAEDDGQVVGFVHAGFGPNTAETDLSFEVGLVCAIAVRPAHRRKKVGSQLLKHAEDYLRKFGATQVVAGGMRPLNPFYFGLYGGADSPGFLTSDSSAAPFFEHHGYAGWNTCLVFELSLEKYSPPVDPRFLPLRRRYDVQLLPHPEISSWWQDAVLGQFEPVEFRLTDKLSGIPAARALVWEMTGRQQGQAAAGLLDVQVRADVRRQGLARFMLAQLLRYIHDQYFKLAQVHVPELNHAAVDLVRGLGFEQVDVGRTYRREAAPPVTESQPVPAQSRVELP
jgi:ribosomal protein S18 acetylase RimI-like enzyme